MTEPKSRPPVWPVRVVLSACLLAMLLWLGVVSLLWNGVAFLLYPVLPAERGKHIGRAAIAYVYRFYWAAVRLSGMMRIEAEALDVLRDEPGGLIVAANHPSLLDAMLIVARLPRGVCIMKASLSRNIFLGAGSRLARYISNESTQKLVRGAVQGLRQGDQLVLFPEGTRSPDPHSIHPLRPGITLIAHRAKVPIQTVVIETDSPYLGKGWPLWRLPPLPIVFRARLGERFEPEKDHDALLVRMEDYFRKELGR